MVCSAVPRLRSTFSIATFRYRRTCAKEQARGLDQSASLQKGGYLNNLQASHLPNLLLFSSETNDIGHKSCHQNCFIPANWSLKGKLPRLQLRHHQLDKLDMVGGKTTNRTWKVHMMVVFCLIVCLLASQFWSQDPIFPGARTEMLKLPVPKEWNGQLPALPGQMVSVSLWWWWRCRCGGSGGCGCGCGGGGGCCCGGGRRRRCCWWWWCWLLLLPPPPVDIGVQRCLIRKLHMFIVLRGFPCSWKPLCFRKFLGDPGSIIQWHVLG